MTASLWLTPDQDANRLLSRSPLAVMIGMLLDQQIPMEWAFTGPHTIAARMNRTDLDAAAIAAYDPQRFADLMATTPAVHRYPAAMAERVQKLCRHLVDHYGGDAQAVWEGVDDADTLLRRLRDLPGFGPQKSQVFLALLGKQLGVTPSGWREAAGDYGAPDVHRSIADVTDAAALEAVRRTKQEAKRRTR
ncbi:HhH-GPD-type base excision DNA repair protein [Stackebrandtia albiflava]|nr:HhH-GPD-type base excision DNA repair protein [Stackebrandtia albiflava]